MSEKDDKQILEWLKAALSKVDPLEALVYGLVAYYGYKAFEDKLHGVAFGLVSLELARADNLVAGGAGLIGLAAIGLANVPKDILEAAVAPIYPPSFEPYSEEEAEKTADCYEACMAYWEPKVGWHLANLSCSLKCGYPKIVS